MREENGKLVRARKPKTVCSLLAHATIVASLDTWPAIVACPRNKTVRTEIQLLDVMEQDVDAVLEVEAVDAEAVVDAADVDGVEDEKVAARDVENAIKVPTAM